MKLTTWTCKILPIITGTNEKLKKLKSFVFDNTTGILNLNSSDFDNNLDNIDISTLLFTDGFSPVPSFYGNFVTGRNELYKLEDLLTRLENNFLLPNANLQNSVNDLDELENYSRGNEVKQHLFDLRDSPGRTSNAIGLDQVLKANANGFIIAQRGGLSSYLTIGKKDSSGKLDYEEIGDEHLSLRSLNVNAIMETLKGGKYRGFRIIDPFQPDPKVENAMKYQTLFKYSCQAGRKEFTKTHIDRFRNFLQINMGTDGGEETDKRKCFGFQITDIDDKGKGHYQSRSGCNPQAGKTKITYDIWAAPNLDEAIDLAFFGVPYAGMKNVDNSLLFLNEVEGKRRKEILDIYYEHGLKNNYETGKYSPGSGYDKSKAEENKDKLQQIKKISVENSNNNELPSNVLSKIREYRASETDTLAQKIYEEAEKMKAADNVTIRTIEKLKELVGVAKNYQNMEEVLEKCKIAALPEVQSKLKRTVGNEQIYQKIITSIEKDAIAISQATEIFTWSKQSLEIQGTDETQEENSSDTEGYATKAYKKIQTFSKKRQEIVDKSHLAKAKTKEELESFYKEMKEGENFTGSLKETVEKKSYPRAEIIASIREKKDNAKPEEKALIELIKDFVIKAEIDTDFGDDSNRTDYQTLKNKQESLAKYTKTGTPENNVFESLPSEQKQTINQLLSELSSKVEKMKKTIDQEDLGGKDNSNNSEKPFYKTTSGIIIISTAVVLVLGLTFWFFTKGSKKKE
nr:8351_t:CDS:2 [Entrophospora candida]